jgi:FKBP-type peptidyl-prolyl cis-trans isomerase FklB
MQAREHAEQKQMEEAAANLQRSNEFFEQNKKRKEVITTETGLQYIVLAEGGGDRPGIDDSVLVSYRAMFLDSTVFDSTDPNDPAQLELQRTIPGLAEGIQLMREGARFRFFIPPHLAFGAEGIPPLIGPNVALIFDVELVNIAGGERRASHKRLSTISQRSFTSLLESPQPRLTRTVFPLFDKLSSINFRLNLGFLVKEFS